MAQLLLLLQTQALGLKTRRYSFNVGDSQLTAAESGLTLVVVVIAQQHFSYRQLCRSRTSVTAALTEPY